MAAPATADTEVRAAFRALLTAERAGYKLATALVSTLVTYLVGSVELSDVSPSPRYEVGNLKAEVGRIRLACTARATSAAHQPPVRNDRDRCTSC